jgi:hypothetical protein
MPRRDLTRFQDEQHSFFESLDDFHKAPVPRGFITIDYNGSPLDVMNVDRGAETTVVAFHSALSPNMRTLPIFAGLGVTDGLETNVICISDPTLEYNDKLKIGWFLGNQHQSLQRDLPAIISKIVDAQHARNLIFFGASAGGFAALFYSSFFPESLAIPLNPQVIVRDFPEESVFSYARTAFGAKGMEEARAYLTRQVTDDVRHVYRGGSQNTVAYVQNVMDTHHLYRHMAPFLAAVPRSHQIHALVKDWGVGHVPPPKEIVRSLLVETVACNGRWSKALSSVGFVSAPSATFPAECKKLAVARKNEATLV